LESTDITTSV